MMVAPSAIICDPREVEAGGLEQGEDRRRADHRHPRADLDLAPLGADAVGVLVHSGVSSSARRTCPRSRRGSCGRRPPGDDRTAPGCIATTRAMPLRVADWLP